MCEAKHGGVARAGEGVERGRLHLHRQHTLLARAFDRRGSLTKWCIRGPACSDEGLQAVLLKGPPGHGDKLRVGIGELGGWRIVIARSLVAQRPLDDHEIGRGAGRNDLAGGGEAEQQATAAGEQLLGDQDGERRADDAADDADRLSGEAEGIELSVIAGPGLERLRASRRLEAAENVAVGVEDAHRRHIGSVELLLAACLA